MRLWVRQADIDDGHAPGVGTSASARMRELGQESRQLRRANEASLLLSVEHRAGEGEEKGGDAARVAADGGFADQSHLHRDVVAFTSATPAAVAREAWLAVDDVAWPERGARHQPPVRG